MTKRIEINQKKKKNKTKDRFFEYYEFNNWWWNYRFADTKYRLTSYVWQFRSPGTKQERTQTFLTEDEKSAGIRIRGKRTYRTLPTAYDDVYCTSAYVKKSWKHNSKRKHQWKYE